MRFEWLGIATTIRFVAGAQGCREAGCNDEKGATQYPLDSTSNSMASDKHSVDVGLGALQFAAKFEDTNYIWFPVKRLDCQRSTPVGYQKASERKYPAIDDLERLNGAGKNVVLSLIKGFKESHSEVRGNAAETLKVIDPCIGLRVLLPEAEGVIAYQQAVGLEAAERRVGSAKDPWDAIRTCGPRAQP